MDDDTAGPHLPIVARIRALSFDIRPDVSSLDVLSVLVHESSLLSADFSQFLTLLMKRTPFT